MQKDENKKRKAKWQTVRNSQRGLIIDTMIKRQKMNAIINGDL